jgi:hypothetical protein
MAPCSFTGHSRCARIALPPYPQTWQSPLVAILNNRRKREDAFKTGHSGDDALLAQIAGRSNLMAPRHWVHYLYCADEASARRAATEIAAGGWAIQGVDAAAQGPGWVVIAEQHNVVTSLDAVRAARGFFEGIAASVDGGDYDGWEASL